MIWRHISPQCRSTISIGAGLKFLRLCVIAFALALVGCASIESNIGKFSDDKYYCSTLRGYQSYLESYHDGDPVDATDSAIPGQLVSNAAASLQVGIDDQTFDAPHAPGRRLEDSVSDRPVDVRFCLERGRERIYFGWKDAKYREFIWSERPFSLRLAIVRSCTLSSFPLSTRGEYVKDSRIQVSTDRMRSFLDGARQSGETQVSDCPSTQPQTRRQ